MRSKDTILGDQHGMRSLFPNNPLDGTGAVGVTVEEIGNPPDPTSRLVAVWKVDGIGHLWRVDNTAMRSWCGSMQLSCSLVDALVSYLKRLGILELRNYCASDILDGSYLNVRYKHRGSSQVSEHWLFCPQDSSEPGCRKLARVFSILL